MKCQQHYVTFTQYETFFPTQKQVGSIHTERWRVFFIFPPFNTNDELFFFAIYIALICAVAQCEEAPEIAFELGKWFVV